MQEPQCISVKQFSPVRLKNAEADTVLRVAGCKNRTICEFEEIPPGSKSVASAQRNACIPGRSGYFRKVRAIEILKMERTR